MSFALHATFVAMLAHVYWPVLKVLDCTLFYKIGGHKLDSQNSQTRLICIFSVLQRVQQNPFSITNLSASASSYSPSAHHGTSAPCTKYCLFTECTAQHITSQHDMARKALHSTAQHSTAQHSTAERHMQLQKVLPVGGRTCCCCVFCRSSRAAFSICNICSSAKPCPFLKQPSAVSRVSNSCSLACLQKEDK